MKLRDYISKIQIEIKLKNLRKKGMKIGDDLRLGSNVSFGSEPYLIEVGKHVTLTNSVRFITHDGGTWVFRDNVKYKKVIKYGKICIRDNVFIGNNVILMPGITIGENCVIGAGSIVTKDVPDNSVAFGCPAKVHSNIHDYAEKCLRLTPEYNLNSYRQDKRKELLKIL